MKQFFLIVLIFIVGTMDLFAQQNANLVKPNLVPPNLVKPNLTQPNLVKPNLVQPTLVKPNLTQPNLVKPNLVKPNLVKPDLTQPNLVKPNLVESDPVKQASGSSGLSGSKPKSDNLEYRKGRSGFGAVADSSKRKTTTPGFGAH